MDSESDIGKNPIVLPYLKTIEESEKIGKKGIKVVTCVYDFRSGEDQHQGFAVLLDISKERLATWIVNACKKNASNLTKKCIKSLISNMINSNGGQYVITGFVSEGVYLDESRKNKTLCQQHNKPIMKNGLIAFRYGVTVQFEEKILGNQPNIYYCTTEPVEIKSQEDLVLKEPVKAVFSVGRVAALHRDSWIKPVKNNVPKGLEPSEWQKIVHDSMLKAIKKDQDDLFERGAWLYSNPKK